ncbi:efflux RND transporter permease subunit [Mucilaginibacter lappiensis]|uniref:efflux RND transporter permease subunit n=1 Tax=Mucilaginibacter lappiensis TaxID=354630 RepID=UPI003D256B37
MFKKFIEQPVKATVIAILLVILGVIGLLKLPLQQFPDIAPPSVLVTAVYPGANAETVLRSVAPSLEEAINGVENMTYMTSTASNDGTLAITVYFTLGTNPDQAAVNIQNRVSQANSQLPPEVVQQGVTTIKQQTSFIMGVGVTSVDRKKYDETFLSNYASINIIPQIKRIPGVGSATIFGGAKDYSMRIWLKPAQLETYHIAASEVLAAIQDKNLEAAPGRFGGQSDVPFEYVVKYHGKYNTPEQYENIVIRANPDGSFLRLKDVARVELGAFTYSSKSSINGKPAIAIGVIQTAGSNSNQIQIAINKLMEKESKKFPPGVSFNIFYSTKIALDESIEQVEHTLVEAFVLVFIVVFIFLQDFRSTLIPAIAVPVAILGTFFFMYVFGFTINLLTLFALVLAIGIVVDDAIVVVEAVHAKMETRHIPAKEATVEAMQEITGAIISITLIMAAVFLPVGFLAGSTGVFYRQFAFTMAIAIIISAINALTLSPALAALFLTNVHSPMPDGTSRPTTFKERFFAGFNRSFTAITERYGSGLNMLIRNKWWSLGGLGVVILISAWLVRSTPTGFIPTEDQGFIAISLSTPPGTSLENTDRILKQSEAELRKLDAQRVVASITGFNILTQSTSPSAGVIFCLLKPVKERGKVEDINQIMDIIRGKLGSVTGGNFFVFCFPTIPGFSNVEALDFVMQDKVGLPLNQFSNRANSFIGDLFKRPEIAFAFSTFRADFPQLQLDVNNDKADQLGVSVKDILATMQVYFGSAQASDFNRFGKYYRVMVQADAAERANPTDLAKVYVKNRSGEMVPISTVVKLSRVYGSETASRYNLYNSIGINIIPKPGFSSGQAIKAVTEEADKLPQGFSYDFSGQTREEIQSSGQASVVFLLCLTFVYFLLCAQYESYIMPFAVILSVPPGVLGVFTFLKFANIANNIYVQVALIMLIGLLAKNAILIIEFALQRRRAGLSIVTAAIEAAKLRLRPILMTSLAFVVGLLPMTIATGPSAQGNHSISIGAVGGMLFGVVLGVLIIPVLFVVFQLLQEKLLGPPKPLPQESAAHLTPTH